MTYVPYVSSDSLKATLNAGSYIGANADIDEVVVTASRAVDLACNRSFQDAGVGTRYYSPRYPMVLEIDDAYAVTAVTTDQDGDGTFESTWVLHQDYELGPDNADIRGIPWERLTVRGMAAYTHFPLEVRAVKVDGSFGWQEPPSQIVTLTRLLAVRLIMRAKNAPFGVVSLGVESAARIARDDPDMYRLICGMRREVLP